MPNSYQIGKLHEDNVESFLQRWGVKYVRQKSFETAHGNVIKLDFWLPRTDCRPAIAIECKNFGVAAKQPANSRRRKVQEALYELVQVRRHCLLTQTSRIIIILGERMFQESEVDLFKSELGPDFHVVQLQDLIRFKALLGVE